jgi:hypothetical protein
LTIFRSINFKSSGISRFVPQSFNIENDVTAYTNWIFFKTALRISNPVSFLHSKRSNQALKILYPYILWSKITHLYSSWMSVVDIGIIMFWFMKTERVCLFVQGTWHSEAELLAHYRNRTPDHSHLGTSDRHRCRTLGRQSSICVLVPGAQHHLQRSARQGKSWKGTGLKLLTSCQFQVTDFCDSLRKWISPLQDTSILRSLKYICPFYLFMFFSSVVRQIPGYNSQRRGTARLLSKFLCCSIYCLFCVVLFIVCV